MRQIFHIFRKDVHHFWREIVVVLLLVALYGWREIRTWKQGAGLMAYGIGAFGGEFVWGLMVVLLPLAWIFLITRTVHDESLVGDRQFWITRPYQWPRLLTEKLLFVLTFISVPA